MPGRRFADGIVQGQRSVDDDALELSPIRHLGQRRRVDRARHVGVHGFHRRQHRHLHRVDAQSLKDARRVLDDIRFLRQRRHDVHPAVGHADQPVKTVQLEHRQMAEHSPGAQANGFVQHRPQ